MKVYLFDIDLTLECSGGPITIHDVAALHREGHCIGLCGNWSKALATWLPTNWRGLFTFVGPMEMTKDAFMRQIRTYLRAEDYVLVGNREERGDSPNDAEFARKAAWRFIEAAEFMKGAR